MSDNEIELSVVAPAYNEGAAIAKDMESVISEVPVISNFLNYENPYFGETNSAKKILNLIDEKKLHKNFLGYKLQIVLQKN